jgi:hypothetical protein
MPGGPCISVTPPSIGRDRPYREPRNSGGSYSAPAGPSRADLARGFLSSGNDYYRQQNWQAALQAYSNGLELVGDSELRRSLLANWYSVQALIAERRGNLKQAAAYMRKAIDTPTVWDLLFDDDSSHQQRKGWLKNLEEQIAKRGEETQECSWTGRRVPPENGVCEYNCSKSGITLVGGAENASGDCLGYVDNVPVPPDDQESPENP